MSSKKKKKELLGLERLRAEYHRFHNELISLRSPCCSQAALTSASSTSGSEDDKDTVWDSTDRLHLPQQEQVSRKVLVEEWSCSPCSQNSFASNEDQKKNVVEAGECSTTPRLRITATTLFTANRGQVVVDECNNTAHVDVNLGSNVPRVTSPPSKSPREPTPRSDATGAVHLPVGEMVLASSSMNIHIGEGGVSSPERTLGYPGSKLASPFVHKFIRPATARRLRLKIKDVLEKMDTGGAANVIILGSTMAAEAGAAEAQAYLQNVVSALSNGSRSGSDRTECVPSEDHKLRDKEDVSERAPDSFREACDQPASQAKAPDELAEVNKEIQCSLEALKEVGTDNKLVQCFFPSSAMPDQDGETKETQCSPDPVSNAHKATDDPTHVPAIEIQKAYNWKSSAQGKAKVDEIGDDDYAKKLLARRAQQNDEFLQRCRMKVGSLLQGFRILEDAMNNPDRQQAPSVFQRGESSASGKETERSASTAKQQKSHPMGSVRGTSLTIPVPSDIPTEGKQPSSRKAKPRLKVPAVGKESCKPAAKSAVKAPQSEEFDYDRMFEELGDLIVERAHIEELDRVQREHLSIPYQELDSYREAVSEFKPREEVMGAKRSRMTRSPAREPGNKLLRLNVGKTQPLLKESQPLFKEGQTSSRFDRLLVNMGEERKKLPKLERLLAFKEEKREKTPRLDRLYAFKLDEGKEKNLKNAKPVAGKKEKLPAWVRRMTETKPKFNICEQLEKEDRDRSNLQGTVKRRNVRPPESIFKAGKHINWLSTSPRQQFQKDKISSDLPQSRKPKRGGLFSEYGTQSCEEFNLRKEKQDRNTQFSDDPSVDTFQTLKTNAPRKAIQNKVPKTSKGKLNLPKDGSEKKKQDWVVVGDFCISELGRQEAYELDGQEGYVDAEEERNEAFLTEDLTRDAEREDARVKEIRRDSRVTEEIPKERIGAEISKPSVSLKHTKHEQAAKVETKMQILNQDASSKPSVVEKRSMGTSTLPDPLVEAGPTTNGLQETDSCRKSLEEELFKQSLLEVLLQNLLDEEDEPAVEHEAPPQNVVEARTVDYHDIPRQRTRRVPDQASNGYSTAARYHQIPVQSKHHFTAKAMQSDQQVTEPAAAQRITSLTRPAERPSTTIIVQSSAQRTFEDHHPVQHESVADRKREERSIEPTLARCLAFKEEPREVEFHDSLEEVETRPEVDRREQRSVGIQITGTPQAAREVLHERPSITVVPITFPILFPIQVPHSQQQQRPPEVPVQTDPDAGYSDLKAQPPDKPHGKEVQTMYESLSSSPSTPSTPLSCPEREELIEAALKPISTGVGSKIRPIFDSNRPLILITESSPRQRTQDKPRFPTASAPAEETEHEFPTLTPGLGLDTELIQDIERRELASPRSDRNSLHVEEMESPRWERDAPGPSEPAATRISEQCQLAFSDEALVAGPYDRVIQHGSPTSSLVFEERHLLSRTKFSFEEEDLVTMSRETLEFTDERRITHIDELESRPSSPEVKADATEKPIRLPKDPLPPPLASTVLRKEKQPEVTEKGKKQVHESDTASRQFEEQAECSKTAKARVFDRMPSQDKLGNTSEKPAVFDFLESRSTTKCFGGSLSFQKSQKDYCAYPLIRLASRQLPVQMTPRLFPSRLNVYLERGCVRKAPLLVGRQVLPLRDMEMLAKLERKAAVALRGKGFRYPSAETRMLDKKHLFSYQLFGKGVSSSHSQISISDHSQFLSESSESTSVSDRKFSDSTSSSSSGSGSDASLHTIYSRTDQQVSEGEVDDGEIYVGRYGDESPEEGEAPSVGEIR